MFVKTYRERRTWLAVFRAFYRVYATHVCLFHAMMAHVRRPPLPARHCLPAPCPRGVARRSPITPHPLSQAHSLSNAHPTPPPNTPHKTAPIQ